QEKKPWTAAWDLGNKLGGTQAEFFVTWVAAPSRSSAATYQIYNGGLLIATVAVDQTQPPVDAFYQGVYWKSLGAYAISGLKDTRVVLSTSLGGTVDADGVLALRVGAAQFLQAPVVEGSGVVPLTPMQLKPVVQEAEQLWMASSLTGAQQAALLGADV